MNKNTDRQEFLEVVALCGSTKFKEEFEKVNRALTLEGKIIISVGVFSHSEELLLTRIQKGILDKIHKRKIDMANSIMVLDVNRYIGDSTKGEIEYAEKQGKKVNYYSQYFDI